MADNPTGDILKQIQALLSLISNEEPDSTGDVSAKADTKGIIKDNESRKKELPTNLSGSEEGRLKNIAIVIGRELEIGKFKPKPEAGRLKMEQTKVGAAVNIPNPPPASKLPDTSGWLKWLPLLVGIGALAATLFDKLGAVGAWLTKQIFKIGHWMELIGNTFRRLKSGIVRLFNFIKNFKFSEFLDDLAKRFPKTAAFFDDIKAKWLNGIDNLKTKWSKFIGDLDLAKRFPKTTEFIDEIKAKWLKGIESLKTKWRNFVDGLLFEKLPKDVEGPRQPSRIVKAINRVRSWWSNTLDKILYEKFPDDTGFRDKRATRLQKYINKVRTSIRSFWDGLFISVKAIKTDAGWVDDTQFTKLGKAVDTVKRWWNNSISAITNISWFKTADTTADAAKQPGLISKFFSAAKEIGGVVFTNIVDTIKGFFTSADTVGDVAKAGEGAAKAAGKGKGIGKLLAGWGGAIAGFLKKFKMIPIIGGVISIGFAIARFTKGEIFKGTLELVSGIASICALFPPAAPFVIPLSMAIDGFLLISDMQEDQAQKKAENKKPFSGGFFSDIADAFMIYIAPILRYVPLIGSFFYFGDSYMAFKEGNWGKGLLKLGQGFIALDATGIGSAINLGIDLITSFFTDKTDGKEEGKESQGGFFSWLGDAFVKYIKPYLKYIPFIGTVMYGAEAWDSFKAGNWAVGLLKVAQAMNALDPSGIGSLINVGIDFVMSFFTDKKEEEDNTKSEGGFFKWIKDKFAFAMANREKLSELPFMNSLFYSVDAWNAFKEGQWVKGFGFLGLAFKSLIPMKAINDGIGWILSFFDTKKADKPKELQSNGGFWESINSAWKDMADILTDAVAYIKKWFSDTIQSIKDKASSTLNTLTFGLVGNEEPTTTSDGKKIYSEQTKQNARAMGWGDDVEGYERSGWRQSLPGPVATAAAAPAAPAASTPATASVPAPVATAAAAPATTPMTSSATWYGDSIAEGYKKATKSSGRTRVGAPPREILGYIEEDLKNNPEAFRGRSVYLSTGVSNNTQDFASIEKQLNVLKGAGAKVTVLGAAKGKYDAENVKLASLAQKHGAGFLGAFKAGNDNVHPATYSKYETAEGAAVPLPVATAAAPSASTPATSSTPATASVPAPAAASVATAAAPSASVSYDDSSVPEKLRIGSGLTSLEDRIANFTFAREARVDKAGNVKVHIPPSNDGGGRFEVAGVTQKYAPEEAKVLKQLVEMGKHQEAKDRAKAFFLNRARAYTKFTNNPGLQMQIVDIVHHRGEGGLRRILQYASGLSGEKSYEKLIMALSSQPDALKRIADARYTYEVNHAGLLTAKRASLREGLINRFKWSYEESLKFGSTPVESSQNLVAALPAASTPDVSTSVPQTTTSDITIPSVSTAAAPAAAPVTQAAGKFLVTSQTRDVIGINRRGGVKSTASKRYISLDFNDASSATASGVEVVLPRNATAEEVRIAQEYAQRVHAFFHKHGATHVKLRGKAGIVQDPKRGIGGVIHTEPFFVNDVKSRAVMKAHSGEYAQILADTFGRLPGVVFMAPHMKHDPGAVAKDDRSFSERGFAQSVILPHLAKISSGEMPASTEQYSIASLPAASQIDEVGVNMPTATSIPATSYVPPFAQAALPSAQVDTSSTPTVSSSPTFAQAALPSASTPSPIPGGFDMYFNSSAFGAALAKRGNTGARQVGGSWKSASGTTLCAAGAMVVAGMLTGSEAIKTARIGSATNLARNPSNPLTSSGKYKDMGALPQSYMPQDGDLVAMAGGSKGYGHALVYVGGKWYAHKAGDNSPQQYLSSGRYNSPRLYRLAQAASLTMAIPDDVSGSSASSYAMPSTSSGSSSSSGGFLNSIGLGGFVSGFKAGWNGTSTDSALAESADGGISNLGSSSSSSSSYASTQGAESAITSKMDDIASKHISKADEEIAILKNINDSISDLSKQISALSRITINNTSGGDSKTTITNANIPDTETRLKPQTGGGFLGGKMFGFA